LFCNPYRHCPTLLTFFTTLDAKKPDMELRSATFFCAKLSINCDLQELGLGRDFMTLYWAIVGGLVNKFCLNSNVFISDKKIDGQNRR